MTANANRIESVAEAEARVVTVRFQFRLPYANDFLKRHSTLLLYLAAALCAIYGNSLLLGPADAGKTEANALYAGAPFLCLAFFIWLLAELRESRAALRVWRRLRRRSFEHSRWAGWVAGSEPVSVVEELRESDQPSRRLNWAFWREIPLTRVALLLMAGIASAVVWSNTSGNRIEPPIILLWLLSALLWAWAFAPLHWNFFVWVRQRPLALRSFQWRENAWIIIAMLLIMILGAAFRFARLDEIPAEMVNDHVVNIHDAYFIYQGEHKIFFSYGGREPAFLYLSAMLAQLPFFGFDHFTIKFLNSVESLLSLPIFFFFGVEMIGSRRRRLGILTGLLLAGWVAVSFWHVVISRLAFRITPTPFFTALLMIYLARAMRRNHRSDFIKAGLVIGFGLYTYTSLRMLPVLAVAGVALAAAIRRITWRERFLYGLNLAVLALVSIMIFLPLLHFAVEEPDAFWVRALSRSAGHGVTSDAWEEAFNFNVPVFLSNIRNALLMFNWEADSIWVQNAPNEPTLDLFSGAFLIVGLAAWLAQMLKSRDPVLWLLPAAIFIMLLPSTLAIAFPQENPSNSRASGVIPLAYLLAAYPLAVIARRILREFPRRMGLLLAVILCGGFILLANHRNTVRYFDRFGENYHQRSYYHFRHAGRTLRGFANSDGAYGNAFVFHRSYHWHHRGIGIEAGELTWPNAVDLNNFPQFLYEALIRDDNYRLVPERDLMFFYHGDDEAVFPQLREWFPAGRERVMENEISGNSYKVYRVPALGMDGLAKFLFQTGLSKG